MVDKQVYELSISDLIMYGAWCFPMDESAENELTIRPLLEKETCNDAQMIVRAIFFGEDGSSYLGYVYWDSAGEIECLKPVIVLEDGSFVTFWNGMVEPSWGDYSTQAQALRGKLPISYFSEFISDLPEVSGRLEGLYYVDGQHVSCIS